MTQINLASRLGAHLDAEYSALVNGDLAKIEMLAADKLAILEQVTDLPPNQLNDFTNLREKLLRNHLLTQSAIEGMRTAILRARAVHDVSTSLRTYNAMGQQKELPMTSGKTLSKRS